MKNTILFALFFVSASIMGAAWLKESPRKLPHLAARTPATPKLLKNEFEILIYRAPSPLDWTSPGALTRSAFWNTWSTVGNRYYPHPISHMNIQLRCGHGESTFRGMAGTKPSFNYLKDFVFGYAGMETLLRPTKGRFYTNNEILAWLPTLKSLGYVRSLKLALNDVQCERLQTYLEEYEEMGFHQIYGGLASDPFKGEGAGCSAFAMSFLETLGLLGEEFNLWKRTLKIPQRLITTTQTSSESGFVSFMTGSEGSWAMESEPHLSVSFWDPELAFDWIKDGWQKLGADVSVIDTGAFRTIVWDVRKKDIPLHSPWQTLKKEELQNRLTHVMETMNDYFPEKTIQSSLVQELN